MNKFYNWLFFSTSNEIIWSKKIQISCMRKKVPFWQFFRKADMALFNLCTKIKNFGGQMYSFNASEVTPGLLAIQIQIQAVWPHPMYASSTNLSRKWGHKKFCIENICRSFKLYLTRNVRMKYEYSCILTQLTAYMLSHTLKSLAIDDAMYASESYWELCVRYIRKFSLASLFFNIWPKYKT